MMMRGTALSYDWYKSGEGQGLLAHLTDPSTGKQMSNCYTKYKTELNRKKIIGIGRIWCLREREKVRGANSALN